MGSHGEVMSKRQPFKTRVEYDEKFTCQETQNALLDEMTTVRKLRSRLCRNKGPKPLFDPDFIFGRKLIRNLRFWIETITIHIFQRYKLRPRLKVCGNKRWCGWLAEKFLKYSPKSKLSYLIRSQILLRVVLLLEIVLFNLNAII